MRRILLLPLLGVTLAGFTRWPADAAPQADAEVQREILKVENERDRAMQKRDMATLDRIYADNIVIVNTQGRVLSKSQRLADFRSGDLKFLSFSQDDYQFHIYGNVVLLTGRASSVVKYRGRINRTPREFILTYIKLDGRWQLVAQNETLVAEPHVQGVQ